MTTPSGNGEARGPDSAPGMGRPLPSRPERARANAANAASDYDADPCPQGGMGTEDMAGRADFMGTAKIRPAEIVGDPDLDLMAQGNPGETFGGGQ